MFRTLSCFLFLLATISTTEAFSIPRPMHTSSSSTLSRRTTHQHRTSALAPDPFSPAKPTSYTKPASTLHSLQPLLDEIETQITSSTDGDTPVIFVGGKGGVGKTSISSSLAVALASSYEHDWKVLIVSTDPAHSLGDALDVDLRHSGSSNGSPKPTLLTDPLTNGKLHALEVDPRAALAEFQSNLELFDIATLSQSIGVNVPPQLLQDLGLDELRTLIRNPPPGLDELVALSNVLDPKNAEEYDVIIVDTAPTGHTLRMLQLPQFLDGFLQTLLKLRQKLKGLVQTIQMFLGAQQNAGPGNQGSKLNVDEALATLEQFQKRTAELRQRLQRSSSTKFVVVTIPTILSVRESQRLIKELGDQGVCVSDLVVNQCIGGKSDEGSEDEISEAMKRYYDRRVAGQQRWISELKDACADVSKSDEYCGNVGEGNVIESDIVVKEVPFYDVELVGVPALGFLGSMTYGEDKDFARLIGFEEEILDSNNPKMIICGGKGGVGKTTTSSSLAVAMASAGHNVALVSTDPAHSLGDALDMDLRGGQLIDVPLIGVPPIITLGGSDDEGSLKVMEIDPTSALKEFRDSIDKLIGKNDDSSDSSEMSSTLRSLGELIDTLPAGTDEVVALAKVIQLIRRGQFDRVVLGEAVQLTVACSFICLRLTTTS
ncbi:predicted protein [Thalassiosira pseudonana CCMP1335]|uniref:ArsA/GET3 Anion-transporting ATPase-like domain-containing protein n=1 Tax=Thalassiosira pseudonana TaxID=35128 RepID=B8BRP8_THAPS|nr:predicted protein [Thalassiosira pseudonana CCMP1335]EED96577.1 predicted protein [Thalassiosira pseudonana CCMP1335]